MPNSNMHLSTLCSLGHGWGELLNLSRNRSGWAFTIERGAYGYRLLEAEVTGEKAPEGLGAGEGMAAALEEADEPREGVLLEASEVGEATPAGGVARVG